MKKVIKAALAAVAVAGAIALAGCSTDATVVSENLSTQADRFEIQRRVIFYNGITGEYMLTIEGRCSIEDEGYQLEVTCKIGPDEYIKDFLGLSDNVTYFVEQSEAIDVSEYHYEVILKPEQILPYTFNVDTKAEEGPGH